MLLALAIWKDRKISLESESLSNLKLVREPAYGEFAHKFRIAQQPNFYGNISIFSNGHHKQPH